VEALGLSGGGLSRRELLTALLGAPLALAACRRRSAPPPLPPGEIVGASVGLGHRVRSEPPPQPARWERAGIVIVGAGVAGLSAAWRLARAGVTDVRLLELEPAPGGTARSGRGPVSAYPWGAHYLPAPLAENRALVTLLDEMGLLEGRDSEGQPVVREQYLCRDPEERIFYRGRWYEGLYLRAGASAADLAELVRFRAEIDRWVAFRDGRGRRAFSLPIAHGSDDAEATALDRLSMTEWLDQRGFHSPRLRWWVDYACRDDYGLRAEATSAWAGLFYFASRVVRAGADSRPLITFPEGNGRLVAHLARAASGRLQLGTCVVDLAPRAAGGVDVVALTDGGASALGLHADQVVLAAPQLVARHLVRPLRERPPAYLDEFRYSAWMVANLELANRPAERGFPLAWDNVLYESPSLGYVCATHQLGVDRGPTVLTYYYPLCDPDERAARARLLGTDWQGWADVTLSDLERAHPELRRLVRRLDVMRWGHAMVRPRAGFLWSGARARAAAPQGAIHFAHSDLSGLALFEEAFHHGVRAAEEVLTRRRVPFEAMT
jgi:protoporphyrinogen oxidase